jgi:NADH-quinone oxidoreductase subunit J
VEITVQSIVFLVLSGITLGGGLLVVISRNLFHAALYLMLSLFGVAGLFVLLTAPLLAGFQVVVYIGAIAILIIFAIMLTPQVTRMSETRTAQWPLALLVAALFFVMLVAVVTPLMDELGADDFNADFTEEDPAGVPADTLVEIGEQLVDPHGFMLPFELASVLLMAALIGAVLLVRPDGELVEAPGDDPAR